MGSRFLSGKILKRPKGTLTREKLSMAGSVLLGLFLCLGFNLGSARAASAWSSGNPTVTQVSSNLSTYPSVVNGQPCEWQNILTNSATNTEYNTCVGVYPYGYFSISGYLGINGENPDGNPAGHIKDYYSNTALVPIPNSDNVFSVSSGAYSGVEHLGFNYDIPAHLTTTNGTGTVSYQINTAPSSTISDAAGHAMNLNTNILAFSQNGQYMVVDAPWVSLLEVNLSTGVVTPFGNSFNYNYSGGSYPNLGQLAVSNDGQFVAVSGQGRFQVYDLNTCGTVPSTISAPVSCNYANFSSVWSYGPNVNSMSFLDDNDLQAYYKTSSSPIAYAKYVLTSYGNTLATQQGYLGLGDSYSSGEGAFDYISGTNAPNANMCHLSADSYPYHIANDSQYGLNYSSSAFHSVACSGATSANLTWNAQYPTLPSPNALGQWTPGLYPQLARVELTQPGVITVGMGGNDIGFASIISKCVSLALAHQNCYASYDARMSMINTINAEYTQLTNDLEQIQQADSTAKIYVIGYPQIVDANGSDCQANVTLTDQDRAFANEMVTNLDYVIKQAAISAGVEYVDVSNAFANHELCDSSQNGYMVNGMSARLVTNSTSSVVSYNESFHPTATGQSTLASTIMSTTSNFSAYSPGTPSNAVIPTSSDTDSYLLLGPYTTSDTNTIDFPIESDEIPTTVYKSGGLSFTLTQDANTLIPNASYAVSLDTGTTSLGTFTTGSNGNLNVSAIVPSSVSDGLHSVHVVGTGSTGQTLDVTQTTAIGESSGEFYGTPDTSSTCVLAQNTSDCLATPTNLSATSPTISTPALSWPTTAGASGYNIYRNGVDIGSTTSASYTDSSATAGNTYSYYVTAVIGGNESGASNTVSVNYEVGAAISGTVTDQNSNPVSGAQIFFTGNNGSTATATTDSTGSYTITSVTTQYTEAQLSLSDGIVLPITTSVDLSTGNATQNLSLSLATVGVTVEDSSGTPEVGQNVTFGYAGGSATVAVNGSNVTVDLASGSKSTTTNSSGVVTLVVPEGEQFNTGGIVATYSDNTTASNTSSLAIYADTSLTFEE